MAIWEPLLTVVRFRKQLLIKSKFLYSFLWPISIFIYPFRIFRPQKRSSLVVKARDDANTTATKKEKKVVVKSIENLNHSPSNGGVQKPSDGVSIKSSTLSSSSDEEETSSTSSTTSIDKCFCFSYSYVVLIGSFFAYMLASLLSTCFGVFFENMESDLGWSKSKVAFIGGLISALQDLTGPISSALTNRYGDNKTNHYLSLP